MPGRRCRALRPAEIGDDASRSSRVCSADQGATAWQSPAAAVRTMVQRTMAVVFHRIRCIPPAYQYWFIGCNLSMAEKKGDVGRGLDGFARSEYTASSGDLVRLPHVIGSVVHYYFYVYMWRRTCTHLAGDWHPAISAAGCCALVVLWQFGRASLRNGEPMRQGRSVPH
jgi:hypothetical protein